MLVSRNLTVALWTYEWKTEYWYACILFSICMEIIVYKCTNFLYLHWTEHHQPMHSETDR